MNPADAIRLIRDQPTGTIMTVITTKDAPKGISGAGIFIKDTDRRWYNLMLTIPYSGMGYDSVSMAQIPVEGYNIWSFS